MTDLQRWAGLEPSMLDVLASYARTALDENDVQAADPDVPFTNSAGVTLYAINRMDDLIELLNPSYETTETFARTLTVLGRHLADRLEVMMNLALDDGDEVWGVAIDRATHALDLIDEAIASLAPPEDCDCYWIHEPGGDGTYTHFIRCEKHEETDA